MKLDHDTEEGVHNIRYKSMNCKRRNQILKKYCFFQIPVQTAPHGCPLYWHHGHVSV